MKTPNPFIFAAPVFHPPSSFAFRPLSVVRPPVSASPHLLIHTSAVVWRTHLLPKSRSAKKVFKNGQFLAIFAQNTFIFGKKCKKMQIFANFYPHFSPKNT
jgi:hypothetical protein